MKKNITVLKTIYFVLLLGYFSGCATLFGPDNHHLPISSEPSGAEIYVNGFRVGSTPMILNLKPDKSYNIEFKKEGFASTTTFLNTKIDAKWVVLDILGGIIPVVVDATSGAWNKFDQEAINVILYDATKP